MTSELEQNVEKLRHAYRMWRDTKGDSVDIWLSLCANEIAFGSLIQGASPMEYMNFATTREDIRDYLTNIVDNWEMLEFEAEHFVAQGDRIVMLGYCSWKSRATGKSVWTPKADSWRFKDGKAVEFYEFFDTARALAAARPDELH
ncbi:nuclear transport factor 2 family protein [Terrarubrum flagellatum]|uniref:nuclear transport factor 2 family protein n=1 Tax=Terrirubrum flagellatum TaxID=2895980 RepID=UPI0031454C88